MGGKYYIPKPSSRIKKCICCVLTIIMLLISNTGFIPNYYITNNAKAMSLPNNSQTSIASGNSNNESPSDNMTNQSEMETSAQNNSVTGDVYVEQKIFTSDSLMFTPFNSQKALTERVYSDNPDYINKVINYSEIPNTFQSTGEYVYQSGDIHMQQVIHMPKMIRNPDVLNLSTLNQNSNNYSVDNSVYGNNNCSDIADSSTNAPSAASASLTNTLAITEFKDGINEDDLNLIDSDSAVSSNRSSSSVASSVYNNQEDLTSQDLSSASVASSVYSTDISLDASLPIQNKSGHFTVGFSHKTGNNLLRFSYKNADLMLNPRNSAATSGSIHKNSISYQEIYPATDLKYTVEPNNLKEELIIKKYTGQTDFYFQLSVNNAVYKITPDSTILFCDPTSGQTLFYMPRPFAIDNAANNDIYHLPEFNNSDGKNSTSKNLPAFYQLSGHKSCDLSYEISKDGILKVSIDPDWLKNAIYPVIIDPSIYIFDAGFYRASIAYNMEGIQVGNGVPRYEQARFNQGILVEEGTTNLLTVNQSNIETSLDPGCVADGTGVTVSKITSQAWEGAASIQASCASGGNSYNGVNIWKGAQGTGWAVTAGQAYTASLYAKGANGGEPFLFALYASDLTQLATVTGTLTTSWQRFSVTVSIPTGKTAVFMIARRNNTTNAVTYYLDGLQLEQKSCVTSWITGGTTRSGEILSIPTANVFTKGNWSVELTYKPTKITGSSQILWYGYNPSSQEIYMLCVDPNYGGTLDLVVCSKASGTMYTYGIVSTFTLSSGTYYNIMATGNGSTLNLYCNGQLAGSAPYMETVGVLPPVMGIGCRSYINNSTLYYGSQANGIIDDLRISNRARTATEALAAYQSNQSLPVDAYTTCKLSFDGAVSYYATDQTGAGIESYWHYAGMNLGGGWNASVNTWNRNLVLSKQLFSIPGRGISTGENIIYNSLTNKTWMLGNFTGIFENQDGSVTYTKGDGSSYTFTLNGSGGYTAPLGIYLSLIKNGSGNFTIQDKYKNIFKYINNKPYQFIDRNNNITTFSYDSSGRLYQVIDASGRPITYTYDPVGRIVNVIDPGGHAYQFGYQNNLTSVTDPANNTYVLSYDANGHLASFTDPLNRVTTFNINSGGQLLSYNDARTNGQDVYTTTFSHSLQGNTMVTTITDPGSRTNTYYHNTSTGNLIKKQDGIGNTWSYTWTNNNLTQAQDTKGTTSYQYDNMGNMIQKTITVDSNPANNIVETMTYNSNSELLTRKDNSNYNNNNGREINYKYSSEGNLLSTSDPNEKVSSSYSYDQRGNIIQYNPDVLGYHNLILNGSMEMVGTNGNLPANWDMNGSATVSLDNSFHPHGNYSLKISNTTTPHCYFRQDINNTSFNSDALTLRAEVKLNNVTGGISSDGEEPFGEDSSSGLKIGFLFHDDYGNYAYVYTVCTGSGRTTITLPTTVPFLPNPPYHGLLYHVQVFMGLNNSSGTAWLDGVQLLCKCNGSQEHIITQFNSVENNSFEGSLNNWIPGGAATVNSSFSWGGSYSLKMTAAGTTYQDVPTYAGEPLTLSGMINTSGISGSGACYRIDYYDASNNLISGASVQTGYISGTQGWTRMASMANAPANANHARIQCILNGNGTVYFDDVKLIPINSMQYNYDKPSDYSNPGSYTGGNYMTLSEDALGIQNAYAYNPNVGNTVGHADPLNHITWYYYDALNRLIQVTDPLSRKAYYQYDPVSNLIYTRDPRSASSSDNTYSTFYGPNNLNRLSALTDSQNQSATYTYDRSGNLTGIALPNGQSESLEYDNANRLTRIILSDGKYYNYYYDGAGELISVTDQNGAGCSWNYDGAHRVTSTTDPFGYQLNYSLDKSNNLELESGIDYSCHYYYDGGNNMYKLYLPGAIIYYGRDDQGRVFNVEYNPSYTVNHQLHYATSQRIINYLVNGWCSSIQDQYFPYRTGYSYGYYADGTISGYSSWNGTHSFSYDADGRLASWTHSGVQQNYTYDAAGNLLTKGNRTFAYNNINEITSPGFTYDQNGNMTGDGSFNYTYNPLNQLVRVNKVSDGSLVATYTYNHDGTRRNKVTAQGTTNYNWDASGNLIREIGPNGTYCYYYALGKLIAFENNHQLYIVHDNLRGDVISLSMTDDYGNTDQENRYDYDPWGTPICEDESVKLPFRYAGYYYDEETGLYYLKSRYYSPALGRFLTRDDHSFINHADPQTLNLYAYCGNNPVNYVDPDGNTIDDIKSGLRNAGNAVYNEARTWADAWLDCPFTGGAVFTGGIGIIKRIKGVGNFKKYSPAQIEKNYGLKKGQFHREIKGDILSDLTGKNSPYKDQMKKMGNNPDVYLTPDGQIQIVSTQFKGNSFKTDLNIKGFLP
ncbi:RHS repeat-associated core domain-containing protein [Desulfofarcimen acetoxidans]|uniref:RHS repeat-associated core domain-containing protein n=1 Tax=Desulfofarcimen acetoxidans TaxID=58138 RepID=UPI00019E4CB8|nr:RHS repeat-associated core domain-containing protein [Desulfofarcimen acetoxidans]